MSDASQQSTSQTSTPPVSSADGTVQEMVANGSLGPPRFPGLAAQKNDYDIARLLGCGAMGLVFEARKAASGEVVALKFLRQEFQSHPVLLPRFLHEAAHLKALRHPHVVPVLEICGESAGPFFVMPFYAKGTLCSLLRKEGPLNAATALRISIQLAQALQFIHSKGLIHRDVKPGNILLESDEHIRLSDFGLSQSLYNDPILDPAKITPQGSAPYMSPQIANGQAEDTRCDIYAFGAMLYQMLTGKLPYEGGSLDVIEKIKQGLPPPILKLNPEAHPGLVTVAEGAMAREHRDRYANMSDVVADLQKIEAGLIPAGPSGRVQWSTRIRRRLPAFAGASASLALAWLVVSWATSNPELEFIRTADLPEAAGSSGVTACNWDGDGEPDLAFVETNSLRLILATGENQTCKLTRPAVAGIFLGLANDFDKDGLDEVLISWGDGTNSHIEAINGNGFPLLKWSFPQAQGFHRQLGPIWSHVQPSKVVDLDTNGVPELLAEILMSWGPTNGSLPWLRGLACFDTLSGTPKWFFETAPFVKGVETGDIDGDGKLEIILGSHSASNGKRLSDGTDDSHAYIFVLNCSGDLIWRKELAAEFSMIVPIGVSASPQKTPRIMAFSARGIQLGNEGEVFTFAGDGVLLHRYSHGKEIRCARILPSAAGDSRIVLSDSQGNLHLLGSNLQVERNQNLTPNDYNWVDLDIAGILPERSGKSLLLLVSERIENKRQSGVVIGNNRTEVQNFVAHLPEAVLVDEKLNVLDRFVVRRHFSRDILTGRLLPAAPNGRGATELLVLLDKAYFLKIKGL